MDDFTNASDVTKNALDSQEAISSEPDSGKDFEGLLEEVQGLKPVFVGIVDYCREPKSPVEVDSRYEELTEFNQCVFSPVRVRAMLEEVGALRYDEPRPEEECVPDVAEGQDGEELLIVTERPEGVWVSTELGIAVIDSFDSQKELEELFGLEPEFLCEYRKVLVSLAENPMTIGELGDLVNDDEPMRASHRFAPFLIKRLESCGAVEFRGKWTILDEGRKILESDLWNRM